ncbi:MAG TPA: Cyclin D1-binding domain-containing protein [Verrucomicrobiae bacterium]|nr:Cyclin D1-binding domain-containing protein [Verrucomicrobiae bacterium]
MPQTTQTTQISAASINLAGEWIGHYRGHFDQVIKITQLGEEIVAVKITGDEHVPGGSVTFRANVRTGAGEGQVAEKEYRNACFVPGRLEITTPDRISFTWENCGKVEFRKDD